jgi:NAD(P)H-nitrite reductase large subunit
MVVSAEGDAALKSVSHAPVDDDWRPLDAGIETVDVDTLSIGFGFVPRVQLAQMAGCALTLREDVGGWVPVRDAHLETSVRGIYAAGDGAGVAGALVASLEGRLAGLSAAHRLGALHDSALAVARRPLDRRLRRIAPLRRALDRISALRPGLAALVREETVVCRCEETTWREVKHAVLAGCTTHRSLKVATRLGMGACQGCFCWPSASRLVAATLGCGLGDVGPASARPPVRPITLGALAKMPLDQP